MYVTSPSTYEGYSRTTNITKEPRDWQTMFALTMSYDIVVLIRIFYYHLC